MVCAACVVPSGPLGTGTATLIVLYLPLFYVIPNDIPVSGTFGIAQFTFQALSGGFMNLQLNDEAGWWDYDTGATIPTTYVQANIVVGPPIPVPAAAWLFGSALGVLGWLRVKRSG